MGFNFGSSESQQQSSSQSSGRSFVWENQIPYLENLYKTGTDALTRMMGDTSAVSAFQAPAADAWRSMLQGSNNPALGGAIKSAQARAAEGFAENVLPALQNSAIASGNLGGERGAISAGIAGREAARNQADIAQNMTFADYGAGQERILQALQMTGGLSSLSQSSLAPLLALAQVIGRPTLLSEQQSSSQGSGSSDAFQVGVSMYGK
jgi:hypothetical protein